ncbi:MAG: aminoacyl-tRNA hydrolase [bacterium]|nr:aminoacyl-tRNA hydrolase [bacterium]
MIIIIGLGNPGEKFKDTRHNVGFMVLDNFAEKNDFPEFVLQKKYSALISEKIIGNDKIILAKPQTFMNESGKTAKEILKNNKSQLNDLIIIHDDIDLPIGKIKIVKERGSAGHKGVESIIKNIGNEGLIRIRIGIGSEQKTKAMSVVLKKFTKEKKEIINSAVSRVTESLGLFIKEGLEKTMNEYNK